MFRSAQEALRFAFNTTNRPILNISGINSMRGAAGNGDMTPHDRHAQAAIIMALVERAIDVNGQAYVMAHYGRELAGSEHERALVNHLVRAVIETFPPGTHYPRGVEKLVRNYFGQNIGMSAVRCDLHCGINRANEYRDWVHQALSAIGKRAEYEVDAALRSAGLILEDA